MIQTLSICMFTTPGAALPPPLAPALVGRPCRAHNVLAGRFVRDPITGRSVLVLTDMNETTGAELIFIDPRTGRGWSVRAPAGSGSWALLEVPGDRLVVGTFYDGRFMVFDMRTRRFTAAVPFPGESYIWNLAIGKDGRVYGGTYPHGKLGAFDLERLTVEDCGSPAPPNMYLRNVSPLPDGRILCSFGMHKPCTLIYDPATKHFEPPPPTLQGVVTGAVWEDYFVSGSLILGPSSLLPASPTPFPVPAAGGAWTVDVNLTTRKTLWLRQGDRLYRYERGADTLELFSAAAVPGGRLCAASEDGMVAGVRGQEYFIVRKGDRTAKLHRIPCEGSPRPTLFLRCDGRGRVWGGPHFGQTLFFWDARAHRATNTMAVSESGGEVYDVAFIGSTVFAASYAGGEIIRYDPDLAWTPGPGGNPRAIAEIGSRGYIRPTGGIVLGDDGLLYSGWMARYGTYGGAIAVTNPNSGETRLLENPLGEQAIAGVGVARDLLFVGTSLGANGLPGKTGQWARFGVLRASTGEVVSRNELTGISSVRILSVSADGERIVLLAGDGKLGTAEPPLWTPEWSRLAGAPLVGCNSVAVVDVAKADGTGVRRWVFYGSGRDLVAVDAARGVWWAAASLPERITNVAAWRSTRVPNVRPTRKAGFDLYVSCGADLYRLSVTPQWEAALKECGGK